MYENSHIKYENEKFILEKIEEEAKEEKQSTNTNNDDNKDDINKDLIKPLQLQNFDTPLHLHKNIISYDTNCKDNINKQSYYCISCKQSICELCGMYQHKDHLLIQRDNCLFYDHNFFIEISKIIDISLKIGDKKNIIKDMLENNILFLKDHLEKLKNDKFKEIDDYFDNINRNMIILKKNFDETKSSIENYYNRYNKFFNIKYVNENINISDQNINNLDIENTIFLMNFDLMNLCDNKNLKVLDKANEILNKVNSIDQILSNKVKYISEIINSNLDIELVTEQFENFYYDVNIRLQKFSGFFNQFKDIVAEIIQKNGSFDKIEELLELFDSKNKKNKDIIFQQKFFMDNKNISTELTNIKKDSKNDSNDKRNAINKNNLRVNNIPNNKNDKNKTKSKSVKKLKIGFNKSEQNIHNNSAKNKDNKFNFITNSLSENNFNNKNQNESISNKTIFFSKLPSEDVTLNNRILQRFFSYSAYEFYINYLNSDSEYKNMEYNQEKSSYKLKSAYKNRTHLNLNNSYIKEKKNSTKKLNMNSSYINKKELFSINNEQDKICKNQYNIKSMAYLSNYKNRYNSLKELAKPIIGTNQIQLFVPSTKKIIKKTTPLNKENHGYSIFPDGCRHILIDNILYITGGNNKCGFFVLSYDILSNKLTRLSNFISEHCFHTLEYIDNFDCIICIGGENSGICEIMDINTKKWKKLPSLNYPRANCNVYYNNINERIYVLFGMKGNLWEKNSKNIDKIEMLELNNINKGWTNVEYYKSCGIDLKFNFCKTIPFTKDKLIISGGNNIRNIENQNLYVIFDMNKNEIFRGDKQTMEMIKLEEKKIRMESLSLTKFNQIYDF